jgi:uncharacterized protein (TIGR03435 family)
MRRPILPGRRQSLAVIAALSPVLIIGVITRAAAQTTSATPAPTFDVVSIKHNTTESDNSSMRQTPNGGFTLVNGSVSTLISRAYAGLPGAPLGLPDWATRERLDVTATASLPRTATPEDRQAMMRAMLAERFKLAAHIETQDQPAFDLVLARKDGRLGSGLKPSEVDCAARAAAQRAAADAARAAGTPPPPPTFTPPAPGSVVPPCTTRMMGNVVEGDMTMASLASLLRSMAGRYVVDKTGLTGSYRVKLESVRLFQGPSLESAATTGGPDDTASIFTALTEQLGLKLESSRAQVEVLVIDHIERPSEN